MVALNIPNTLTNGSTADASEVEANFQAVESHSNSEVVHRDGSIAMTGQLQLAADPVADNDAARKAYVDDTDLTGCTAIFRDTVGQTLSASTSAEVAFDSITNDTDGWYSGGTFTCPATGFYAIGVEFNSAVSTWRVYFADPDGATVGSNTFNNPLIHHGIYDYSAVYTLRTMSDYTSKIISMGGAYVLRTGQQFKLYGYNADSGASRNWADARVAITRLALI